MYIRLQNVDERDKGKKRRRLEEPLLEAKPLAREAAERVDPVDIVHKDVHGFCHAGSGASGRHDMFQFHVLRQLSTSFGIQLEDHLEEEAVQHGLRVFGARGCRQLSADCRQVLDRLSAGSRQVLS